MLKLEATKLLDFIMLFQKQLEMFTFSPWVLYTWDRNTYFQSKKDEIWKKEQNFSKLLLNMFNWLLITVIFLVGYLCLKVWNLLRLVMWLNLDLSDI